MKSGSNKLDHLPGAPRPSWGHALVRSPWRGVRNRWRPYALLGLGAVFAFVMAFPGAASACVNTCTGGTVAVDNNGFPYCSGGGNNGQQVCSGGNSSGSGPSSPNPNLTPFDRIRLRREMGGDIPFRSGFEPFFIFAGSGDFSTESSFNHLGMYVSPNGGTSGDVAVGGGGYSLRNSGVSISDTAGLIAPGTNSASYRENGGGGGISGTYDASRFVGPNQHLLFNGAFNYSSSSTNFGGVGAGSSINGDNYSFTGTALYSNYNTYLALQGSYQFGNNSEFNSSDNSTGSYRNGGYDVDATVGHVFWLLNTMSQPGTSRMPLKAPPRTTDGYAIGLDLSGHLGYQSSVAGGFMDSSGFVFGDERVQGGETGLKAKLFAIVPNNELIWTPYVTGTVDWRFSYSHVANFPGQLALATGDAVSFADATTFVGAKVGLDVKTSNGWIVGANGFYEHSSDTEIAGGKAYVRIPFGATAVTARY